MSGAHTQLEAFQLVMKYNPWICKIALRWADSIYQETQFFFFPFFFFSFDAALYRSIIHSEMFHKLAGIKLPIRECLKPPPE